VTEKLLDTIPQLERFSDQIQNSVDGIIGIQKECSNILINKLREEKSRLDLLNCGLISSECYYVFEYYREIVDSALEKFSYNLQVLNIREYLKIREKLIMLKHLRTSGARMLWYYGRLFLIQHPQLESILDRVERYYKNNVHKQNEWTSQFKSECNMISQLIQNAENQYYEHIGFNEELSQKYIDNENSSSAADFKNKLEPAPDLLYRSTFSTRFENFITDYPDLEDQFHLWQRRPSIFTENRRECGHSVEHKEFNAMIDSMYGKSDIRNGIFLIRLQKNTYWDMRLQWLHQEHPDQATIISELISRFEISVASISDPYDIFMKFSAISRELNTCLIEHAMKHDLLNKKDFEEFSFKNVQHRIEDCLIKRALNELNSSLLLKKLDDREQYIKLIPVALLFSANRAEQLEGLAFYNVWRSNILAEQWAQVSQYVSFSVKKLSGEENINSVPEFRELSESSNQLFFSNQKNALKSNQDFKIIYQAIREEGDRSLR